MAEFNIRSNISSITGQFSQFSSLLSGGFSQAIGVANKALLTLAANPIGAVVAALGVAVVLVTSQFGRFQTVIDEIDVAISKLSAAWNFLIDTVGSYLGIADGPSESFTETIKTAGELTRQTQALDRAQIELTVTTAELRAENRRLQLIASDQTLSEQERIAALQEAQGVIREQFQLERSQAEERVRILQAQNDAGDSNTEALQELADLRAMLIDLDSAEAAQLRTINTQQTSLTKRIEQRAEAEAKAAQARADRARQEEEREAEAAQKEVDRIREIREEREIDLLIAGGATEEEVFQARLERAETQEEIDQLMHEETIRRIREQREEENKAAEDKEAMDKQVMEVANATAASEAEARNIAENAKRSAIEATAGAALNTLTSLLGESKGAQIAGLIAQQAFEAAKLISSGTRDAAAASTAATAAAVPTFGASLAALPAQLAAISASTTGGLVGVGIAAATGIAGILASPGQKPSGGGGGGGGGSSFSGPTVETPDIGDLTGGDQQATMMQTMMDNMSTVQAVVSSGDIENTNERNARAQRRRKLGN